MWTWGASIQRGKLYIYCNNFKKDNQTVIELSMKTEDEVYGILIKKTANDTAPHTKPPTLESSVWLQFFRRLLFITYKYMFILFCYIFYFHR